LPGGDMNLLHPPAHGRGDLDLRLVRLHLEERRVLADHVALADQDLGDLGLGQSLAQVGEDERARHAAQKERVSRAAATTRATSGTVAFSRAKPTNGTS